MATGVITPSPAASSGTGTGVETIGSVGDMLSMTPADLFDGPDVVESAPVDEAPAADEPATGDQEFETEDIGDPGPIDGDEQADEEAAADEPPAVAATTPKDDEPAASLPEGVTKGKDRNGKPGLFVEESRWNNAIYPNHQLVQQVSKVLGEPATLESLSDRIKAADALNLLYSDVTSGDQTAQSNVMNHLLDRMDAAVQSGETGVDPSLTFAQTFYSALKDRNSDAYATLRLAQARDFLGEMFQQAAANGDTALFQSARHFVRALTQTDDGDRLADAAKSMGIPYYTDPSHVTRATADTPIRQLQAENARLREQVNGRSQGTQAAQFETWQGETTQAVTKALDAEAIVPALASVQKQWEKFPDDFKRLVIDPLHRDVVKSLRSDPVFQAKVNQLDAEARRATSPQVRAQLRDRIQKTYVNRAKMAADELKGPIVSFAATALQAGASNTHARRQAAQSQTAPRGASTSTPKSLVPQSTLKKMGDTYTPESAMAEMLAYLR